MYSAQQVVAAVRCYSDLFLASTLLGGGGGMCVGGGGGYAYGHASVLKEPRLGGGSCGASPLTSAIQFPVMECILRPTVPSRQRFNPGNHFLSPDCSGGGPYILGRIPPLVSPGMGIPAEQAHIIIPQPQPCLPFSDAPSVQQQQPLGGRVQMVYTVPVIVPIKVPTRLAIQHIAITSTHRCGTHEAVARLWHLRVFPVCSWCTAAVALPGRPGNVLVTGQFRR